MQISPSSSGSSLSRLNVTKSSPHFKCIKFLGFHSDCALSLKSDCVVFQLSHKNYVREKWLFSPKNKKLRSNYFFEYSRKQLKSKLIWAREGQIFWIWKNDTVNEEQLGTIIGLLKVDILRILWGYSKTLTKIFEQQTLGILHYPF